MTNTSLTFALDGEVSLDAFAKAMTAFQALITELTKEISSDAHVEWFVEDLSGGSASSTIRGEAEDPEAVGRIAEAYLAVGRALRFQEPPPYSTAVIRKADAIAELLSDRIGAIRFETPEEVVAVDSRIGDAPRKLMPRVYGSADGRVQAVIDRGGLRVIIADHLSGQPVTCYLDEAFRDQLRDVWDRRVRVAGLITRDALTGRPSSVRRVSAIEPVVEAPRGSFLKARGVLTPRPGSPPPEVTIRRMRDDW